MIPWGELCLTFQRGASAKDGRHAFQVTACFLQLQADHKLTARPSTLWGKIRQVFEPHPPLDVFLQNT